MSRRLGLSSARLDSEEDQLAGFLALLTKKSVRQMSIFHKVLLPRGARLRGIEILPDLWLARDMNFYKLFPGKDRATLLTLRETLEWVRLDRIKHRLSRAYHASWRASIPPDRPVS